MQNSVWRQFYKIKIKKWIKWQISAVLSTGKVSLITTFYTWVFKYMFPTNNSHERLLTSLCIKKQQFIKMVFSCYSRLYNQLKVSRMQDQLVKWTEYSWTLLYRPWFVRHVDYNVIHSVVATNLHKAHVFLPCLVWHT